ncbi:MAG: hypothetical protein AAGB34_08500 [Planctomycetota bacterium]
MTPPFAITEARVAPQRDEGDQIFELEASKYLSNAQQAISGLLEGVGLSRARPSDVAKALGLDKTLAWKVSRFVDDTDPVSAAKHMPGSGGVEIFLKAAESQGTNATHIDLVRHADRQLRDFMRQHAGDRRSFEAMLAAGGRDPKLEFEERRAFYKAGSAIWGVRAALQFQILILRPSEVDEGMLDVAQIGGFLALERLRPDVPWIFRRLRANSDSGKEKYTIKREPLDPSGANDAGTALVPEFCSSPLPAVQQFEDGKGLVYDQLAPGPVGREGAVDCITGEIYRSAIPSLWAPDNEIARYLLSLRTPVENARQDILLHNSIAHWTNARHGMRGLIEDRPYTTKHPVASPADLQPAIQLGSPPLGRANALHDPALKQYRSIAQGAIDRAGWGSLDEYTGHRADQEFPPAPSELVLQFDIQPQRVDQASDESSASARLTGE